MSRTWTARRGRRRGGGNAAERINNGLLLFPSMERRRRRCRCRCRRPMPPLLRAGPLWLLMVVVVAVPSSSHSSLGSIIALGWAVHGCRALLVALPNTNSNNAPRTSFSFYLRSSSPPSPGNASARGGGGGGGRSLWVRADGVAGSAKASDLPVLEAVEEEVAAASSVERGRRNRKASDNRRRTEEANDPEGGGGGGPRSPSSYPSFFVRRTMEFRSTTTHGGPANNHNDASVSSSRFFGPVQAYRAMDPVATTTTTATTMPRRKRWEGDTDSPIMPGADKRLLLGSGAAARGHNDRNEENPTSEPPPPLSLTSSSLLSKSSVALLDRWGQMSDREQHQLRMKIYKEQLASTPLSLDGGGDGAGLAGALAILYRDEHLCVCVKPSGVLSVPGPRRNPNLANLVYEHVQPVDIASVDHMVVHRLDMDTSGIVVYALSSKALSTLHADFRSTTVPRRVYKTYVALLHGHVTLGSSCLGGSGITEVEIDVALERDPNHLPFMRVAQPNSESEESSSALPGLSTSDMFQHLKHPPKPSLTDVHIVGYEYLKVPKTVDGTIHDGDFATSRIPVTRVRLTPHTGRTHQLRVHMASVLGHPIVGDDIYGNAVGGRSPGTDEEATTAPTTTSMSTFPDPSPSPIDLCLCAQTLCLYHPVTGAQLEFSCVPPF